MNVEVTNVELIKCKYLQECYKENLFVMPLRGYEMVLRVQWLSTLRDMVWNFDTFSLRIANVVGPCLLTEIRSCFVHSTEDENEVKKYKNDRNMQLMLNLFYTSL